jgi:hypothetical protein
MLANPGASCVDAAAPVQGAPVNGFVPAGVFTRPVGGAGETGSSRSPGKTRELLGLTALSAELLVFCASEAVAAVRTKITEPIMVACELLLSDLRDYGSQSFFPGEACLEFSLKSRFIKPSALWGPPLDLPLPNSPPPFAGYDDEIINHWLVVDSHRTHTCWPVNPVPSA